MKISVAMCTYNGACFVEEQLHSILEQVLPVQEIVICDDGSHDETIGVVRHIASSHSEIEWIIHQNSSNLGVIKNFEKAIELCTGDFIFLSDQDDVWHKEKTKIISDYFEENPDKSVVFTDANIIGENGRLLSNHSLLDAISLLPKFNLWEDGLEFEILNVFNVATGATMALRKSFRHFLIPFVNSKSGLLHDYQIAKIACKHHCLGVIRDKLINYRQHGGNVIGVTKDNWIYTNESSPNLLQRIVEPRKLTECFQDWDNSRVRFYLFRYHNYITIWGKAKLLFSIFQYCRFYRNNWFFFYTSDILYKINEKIRIWIISRY